MLERRPFSAVKGWSYWAALVLILLVVGGCNRRPESAPGSATSDEPVAPSRIAAPPEATTTAATDVLAGESKIGVTATLTASATISPTLTPVQAALTTNIALNIRSGPGTEYPTVGVYASGAETTILSKNLDGSWWRITCPQGVTGDECWVTADSELVSVASIDNVAVTATPTLPPPTLPPTATPAPTATPCVRAVPVGWVPRTIVAGDRAETIARETGTSAQRIQEVNCLPSADFVRIDQTLYVPPRPETIANVAASTDSESAPPAAMPGAVTANVVAPAAPSAPAPAIPLAAAPDAAVANAVPLPQSASLAVPAPEPIAQPIGPFVPISQPIGPSVPINDLRDADSGIADALGFVDPLFACATSSPSATPAIVFGSDPGLAPQVGQKVCIAYFADTGSKVTVRKVPGSNVCPQEPDFPVSELLCPSLVENDVWESSDPTYTKYWCPTTVGTHRVTLESDGEVTATVDFCVAPPQVPLVFVNSQVIRLGDGLSLFIIGPVSPADDLYVYRFCGESCFKPIGHIDGAEIAAARRDDGNIYVRLTSLERGHKYLITFADNSFVYQNYVKPVDGVEQDPRVFVVR